MNELFNIIFNHISKRVESLSTIEQRRFREKGIGLEGWLKVEILKALELAGKINIVKDVKGKGPDLIFKNGLKVELKAASDFNYKYFLSGLGYKNCSYCIFLGYNEKDIGEEDVKKQFKIYSEKEEIDLKKEVNRGGKKQIKSYKGKVKIKENPKVKEIRKAGNKRTGWFLGLLEKAG